MLLAVVEVPQEDRVRCAAEGCGHSVYRRVHLVRIDATTKVYGSDCFARLFGSTPTGSSAPRYGSGTGRSLTPEERALLIHNTERLIEQFEREHQAAIAAAERRHARQAPSAPATSPVPATSRQPEPRVPTQAQRAAAEAEARRALGHRFPGVNLDLPGFAGLLRMEVDKLLRAHAAR